MSLILQIRERLRKAHLEPATFQSHAASDIAYLLEMLDGVAALEFPEAPARKQTFSFSDVFYDDEGHACLPVPKKAMN